MATAQLGAQARSRQDLEQRFAVRGTTAVAFLESYTTYTLDRERALAEQRLAAPAVSDVQFHDFLDIFGFGPAVLLDSAGHDLDVSPFKAAVVGSDLGARYEHLRSAVAGRAAVSNVVASAAQGVPIVAFATPFDTPKGRRVVSGAYDLASRPMGLYLRHVLPYADGVAYLVDGTGHIIASSNEATGLLDTVDRPLRSAVVGRAAGSYRPADGHRRRFVTADIAGTPWRLVLTVPEATLLEPISGDGRLLPWLFLGAFGLAAALLLVLFVRNREGKAGAELSARTDPLTGIGNRRATDEELNRLLADHRRYAAELGVLLIDIDRFKLVNDRFGHGGGDIVLREVVERAGSCLRTNDLIGRWGGEEFVVLLPNTGPAGVATVAERVRAHIAAEPISVRHATCEVTISIGAAMARLDDDDESILRRADSALYTAKTTGRNRCVIPDGIEIPSSPAIAFTTM